MSPAAAVAGLERRRSDRNEAHRPTSGRCARRRRLLHVFPSAVHWLARRYRTPFLQIVYNNRGTNITLFSAWPSPVRLREPHEQSGHQLRPSAGLRRDCRGRGRGPGAHGETAGRGGGAIRSAIRRGRRETFRGDLRLALTLSAAGCGEYTGLARCISEISRGPLVETVAAAKKTMLLRARYRSTSDPSGAVEESHREAPDLIDPQARCLDRFSNRRFGPA